MNGYILFDKSGKRLTHNLTFSDHENAGWLWSVDEAMEIISQGVPVVYCQAAELLEKDGDVNVYVLGEIEEI